MVLSRFEHNLIRMKSKSIKEEIVKLDKVVKWILISGVVVLIAMPIVATQLDWFFDYTNTGQIGDTIGGLTAPVIGVVSALLIYFSFRAQINANRIIQDQIDDQKLEDASKRNFEHQMERYRHLKEYIDDFSFAHKEKGERVLDPGRSVLIRGGEAISQYLLDAIAKAYRQMPSKFISVEMSQLKTIVAFFVLILNNIKPSVNDKNSEFIFNLIEIKFYRNIWDARSKEILMVVDNRQSYAADLVDLFKRIIDIEIELRKLKDIWLN